MALAPFHVAVPVNDLSAARAFYGELLGCPEGRSTADWVDFNLFGHQFVCHRVTGSAGSPSATPHNEVDGHAVPVPHYGVVLEWGEWERLAERLRAGAADFVMPPTVRFAGEAGEQATLFLRDPAGNALEFKAMRNPDNLFARD